MCHAGDICETHDPSITNALRETAVLPLPHDAPHLGEHGLPRALCPFEWWDPHALVLKVEVRPVNLEGERQGGGPEGGGGGGRWVETSYPGKSVSGNRSNTASRNMSSTYFVCDLVTLFHFSIGWAQREILCRSMVRCKCNAGPVDDNRA